MTNEMSLSFSATLENEPFVRTCIASFVVCLNPTVDEIVEIKTVVGRLFLMPSFMVITVIKAVL